MSLHRSVCTHKQSQILDILGNIEIVARIRPGKIARMVTLQLRHFTAIHKFSPVAFLWDIKMSVKCTYRKQYGQAGPFYLILFYEYCEYYILLFSFLCGKCSY